MFFVINSDSVLCRRSCGRGCAGVGVFCINHECVVLLEDVVSLLCALCPLVSMRRVSETRDERDAWDMLRADALPTRLAALEELAGTDWSRALVEWMGL